MKCSFSTSIRRGLDCLSRGLLDRPLTLGQLPRLVTLVLYKGIISIYDHPGEGEETREPESGH